MNYKKKNKKATISVKQSKEKTNHISSSISKTNVYIKGLNENITDNNLFEMCSKYGEIKVNLVECLLFRKEILLGYFKNKRRPSFPVW